MILIPYFLLRLPAGSFTASRKPMLRVGYRVAEFAGHGVKQEAPAFITYVMMSRKFPASEKTTQERNEHEHNDTHFFHR